MSDQRDAGGALTRALRAMGREDEKLGASPDVEARLLVEARAVARARRRRAHAATAAVAAVLLVAILLPDRRTVTSRPPAADPAGPAQAADVPAGAEVTTEFFPLMYSNVPVTNGQTVRLELPQAALASFGLAAGDPSATVLADVVVGQDGLARAVRFVRQTSNVEEQRQ
jgi:hypothetical protein